MTRRNPAKREMDELARKTTEERDRHDAAPPRTAARRERAPGRLRSGAVRDSARAVPLRRAQDRTHRLALSGELRHDSAVQLEAEIDDLCETGIGTLVLDLSGLRAIDATGLRVIRMRCALCRRRGMRIAIEGLAGTMREALENAGLLDGLPLVENATPGEGGPS